MADDRDARIAQLEAEMGALREREAAGGAAARAEAALSEALERQTALAEVLRVIASSPTSPEQVLDEIAETARSSSGDPRGNPGAHWGSISTG